MPYLGPSTDALVPLLSRRPAADTPDFGPPDAPLFRALLPHPRG